MKKEDVKAKIQSIGALESAEEMRTQLATFNAELEKDYDERDQLQATNETLTKDMESLRQTNMQLFLQIGQTKADDKSDKGGSNEPEKLTYENLFNEKGELK